MTDVESAWDRYPGYRIDISPYPHRARVRRGDVVIAESDRALLLAESDHADQLYFPHADIRWEALEPTDHHTTCPFKGQADYWSLTAGDEPMANVVWAYPDPFEEVVGIADHYGFYADRLTVEVDEIWGSDDGHIVTTRFPPWGDAADLIRLIDIVPDGAPSDTGATTFSSPPYPDPPIGTFIPEFVARRPRSVVEGGHLLAQAIVGAAKAVPDKRVTSASMLFLKAALFDAPLHIDVQPARVGRTFAGIDVRIMQDDVVCATGHVLLDAAPEDATLSHSAPMPDVARPLASPPKDMWVTGRELRVVDGAYNTDPNDTGPAEINAWMRFKAAPADPNLNAALLAQATTHWTIGAALRPVPGLTEDQAHVTISTGIMAAHISFHEHVDISEWMLYANPLSYAGRGQVQSQGQVFSEAGRLLATYSIHGMVRAFTKPADQVTGEVGINVM